MKSNFSSPFFEILTVLLLVGHLFWNLSMVIHLGNPIAAIPATIQLVVFVMLFIHHHWLAYWMKIWAVYLLVSGGISFISKLILGISRETYPEGIEWKAIIILTGILIWWIAARKIIILGKED